MTHLSTRRKSTNMTSYNTLTVLTPPSSLQVETNKENGAIPFLTPLLNQKLMGICLSLCTGNPPIQTSIYSGEVTTTSQQNLVLLTSSPIEPKQGVTILSFSAKKWITSGRYSPQCKYPKWALTRWRKGLTDPPGRLLMGLIISTLQVPSSPPMKLKPRVILLYLIHKVFVKESRKSVGVWHTDPLQRWLHHQELTGLPEGQNPMVSKSGAIYWFQCGDLTCDDDYIGGTSRTFAERFKEHLKDPSPIHHHSNSTGHSTSQNNFQIIAGRGMV